MDGLHAQHISSYMYVAAFVPLFYQAIMQSYSSHTSFLHQHNPFSVVIPKFSPTLTDFLFYKSNVGEKKNSFSYFAHNTHLNKLAWLCLWFAGAQITETRHYKEIKRFYYSAWICVGNGGSFPCQFLADDPHRVYLVDTLTGCLEIHHDQVPCFGCVIVHS